MKRVSLGVQVLWALCVGFLLGVFLRSVFPVGNEVAWVMGIFAAFTLLFCVRDVARMRVAFIVATAVFFCGLGILRMESAALQGNLELNQHIGNKVTLEGIISDEPDARNTQVRVPLAVTRMASSTEPIHVKALVILPAHVDVFYGERIQVSGTLHVPQAFDAGAGRKFNYPGYLAVQGIEYELDRAAIKEPGNFEGNPIVGGAYRVKELFVSGLQNALPEPVAGLAGGITAGDKRALGKDITNEFRTVSLVHIIVLSGYNITVVISALFRVLVFAPRLVRFGTGVFVAIFFAVMTGFASASLRAALMALIAISGSASGRIYRADRALALVSAGMVLWNPYLLVFDPGFQLSFLATAGLIVLSPFFEKWFAPVPETFGLREIAISTSSAQIAVLPLLLYESGNLSLVALPANLLVLAAIPPAMLASFVAAIGGLTLGSFAPIVGFPAYALLSYVLFVSHALASIPFASVTIPAFSAWLLVPVYGVLFGFALWNVLPEKETTPLSQGRVKS